MLSSLKCILKIIQTSMHSAHPCILSHTLHAHASSSKWTGSGQLKDHLLPHESFNLQRLLGERFLQILCYPGLTGGSMKENYPYGRFTILNNLPRERYLTPTLLQGQQKNHFLRAFGVYAGMYMFFIWLKW